MPKILLDIILLLFYIFRNIFYCGFVVLFWFWGFFFFFFCWCCLLSRCLDYILMFFKTRSENEIEILLSDKQYINSFITYFWGCLWVAPRICTRTSYYTNALWNELHSFVIYCFPMLRKCAHFGKLTGCAHLAITIDKVDAKVSLVSALPPVQ